MTVDGVLTGIAALLLCILTLAALAAWVSAVVLMEED